MASSRPIQRPWLSAAVARDPVGVVKALTMLEFFAGNENSDRPGAAKHFDGLIADQIDEIAEVGFEACCVHLPHYSSFAPLLLIIYLY
jgi:hypothetical protein